MNWDLIGHQWAANHLQRHIADGSVRHAYLISGPPGIGRKALAVRFVQALNCPQQDNPGVPCGSCRTCRQIEQLEHPDLFPVQSEEGSRQLKINQIRELIHHLSLMPYQAPYRVGLLMDFEEANIEAQNALLKTLEEPGKQVVLVVIASSPDLLLETIVSRCEEIKLRPIPLDAVSAGLQRVYGIPAEQARYLAHISGGRPEYALYLHQNPKAQQRRETLLEEHHTLLSADLAARFAYAENLHKDPELTQQALSTWRSLWHDVLIKAGGSQAPLQNVDRAQQINSIAAEVGLMPSHQVLSDLKRAQALLKQNANTRLTLEDLLLRLPHFS